MESWGNREQLQASILTVLSLSKTGVLPKPVLPDDLSVWLAQATLLYGVPIEYLVPDARLLPTESMRFFYLDRNWLDRMLDGALSAGVLSSREAIFNETFFEAIYDQVDAKQQQLRAELRGQTPQQPTTVGGPITGMIFRSQVVSGWPGLEVDATDKDGNNVPLLRMDRLSSNTLLCLFNGEISTVQFKEPGESLHFGVRIDTGATDFLVNLRGLGFPTETEHPAGEQIPDGNGGYLTITGSLRTGNGQPAGVVNIYDENEDKGLIQQIEKTMPSGALQGGKIQPGGFAIQMVKSAGLQAYKPGSPDCSFTPEGN